MKSETEDKETYLDQLKKLKETEHKSGQVIESLDVDFNKMTWTFRINQDTKCGPGIYRVIWEAK